MIPALLHGKLTREQENMEDILTSNVFGALKYVPAELGLLPFLRKCQTLDARSTTISKIKQVTYVEYQFWPSLRERAQLAGEEFICRSCEPDLLLRIGDIQGRRLIVLIEAKLHSGKSQIQPGNPDQPNDQLAREWDNLACIALKENAEPLLVYLTADFDIPVGAIEESYDEYVRIRGRNDFECAWLSWRHIPQIFCHQTNEILVDLVTLCERLNLKFFYRNERFESLPEITWSFHPNEISFEWLSGPTHSFNWKFET